MVLISNGSSINIKNHHKMKCIEQKNENFNISIINNNKILENIDDGLLNFTILNEDVNGKTANKQNNSQQTYSKNSKNNK